MFAARGSIRPPRTWLIVSPRSSVTSATERRVSAGQSTAGVCARTERRARPQADIVAHSMGGLITRVLALQPTFLSSNTLGQGNIHKLITIDTPHLGTPLAIQLLSSQNNCVRRVLASNGNVSFTSVTMSGKTISGAVGDLEGDGFGGSLSVWLQNIANQGQHSLPTAVIAGVENNANLAGLGTSGNALLLRLLCDYVQVTGLGPHDPLAHALTPNLWPSIFGQGSDATVPIASEINGLNNTSFAYFANGFVHSGGMESLGFTGPAVLPSLSDESNFSPATLQESPNKVIDLLNTPLYQTNAPVPFIAFNP